jgi:hypothetical protein
MENKKESKKEKNQTNLWSCAVVFVFEVCTVITGQGTANCQKAHWHQHKFHFWARTWKFRVINLTDSSWNKKTI